MGQKVSSSPRVRMNYGSPISHDQVVHDPSSYADSGLGEQDSHSPSSVHRRLAMGSSTSQANGHQSYQRESYPSSSLTGGSTSGYAAPVLTSHSQQHSRNRARSLGNCSHDGANSSDSRGLNIPGLMDLNIGQDSDDSSPEDNVSSLPMTRSRGRTFPFHAQSLPTHLFTSQLLQNVHVQGIKCPVCSKSVPSDDVECHLVICLTKPRIVYNEDVLLVDAGECVICLDDMQHGDTIARLPCLCIYHKSCIDMWFERNRSCPEHPAD